MSIPDDSDRNLYENCIESCMNQKELVIDNLESNCYVRKEKKRYDI